MSNKNFTGSVELISGITPKAGADFPLVDAEDIIIYDGDDDTEGMRLPEKLKTIGITESEKLQLKEDIFEDNRFTDIQEEIFVTNEEGHTSSRIDALEEQVGKTDMTNLKMTYRDANSTLYLHDKEKIPQFSEEGVLINQEDIYTSAAVSDNANIKMYYDKSASLLYLYQTAEFDPDNIITAVEIAGGGGASLGVNLALQVIGSDSFATKIEDKTEISFLAAMKDSDGVPANNMTVYFDVFVNGNEVANRVEGKSNVETSFDVSKYLVAEGVYNIEVKASYTQGVLQEDGTTKDVTITSRKVWSIQVINLSLTIESSFQKNTEIVQFQDLIINYTPSGNISKTTYFKINGEVYTSATAETSGKRSVTLKFADFEHGSYNLEIYTSAILNGKEVETDHYYYNIMFGKPGNPNPILRLTSENTQGEQYTELPLSFTIYKEGFVNHDYSLYEEYEEDGATIKNLLESGTVKDNTANNNYKYYTEKAGAKKIILESEGTSTFIEVNIKPTSIDISPVLSGLVLDFTPKGRSNAANDYNVFYNNAIEAGSSSADENITWTLSDNFDWVNGGWQTDEEGNSYFCIKAGTTATINYNLFKDTDYYSATKNGKEFKISFKTSNVTDITQPFLTCYEKAENNKDVGIILKPHEGIISHSLGSLDIPYSEEDIIELDFNITPLSNVTYESTNIPMIMTYEDGTPFRPLAYTSSETSFSQVNPVPITIGSSSCDVHIYRLKAYNTYLEDEFILNNFILDAKNGEEMKARYQRNNISFNGVVTKEMIENGEVAKPLENFAIANPQLRVIGVEAPHFTKSKSNKVLKSKFYYFYKGGRENEDQWVAENCVHNGQGTSSNNYRFAGKNLDLNMKQKAGIAYTITITAPGGLWDEKKNYYEPGTVINEKMDFYTSADEETRELIPYEELSPDYANVLEEEVEGSIITLKNGEVVDKITLTETSVPTNYLNIKVNIASSENANNALLAKRYDRYLPYVSGAKKKNPQAKNTMEFYNCVVFVRETNTDYSDSKKMYLSHQEFNDNNWHFYAIGNVGDSKKTDSTRVTDKDDDNEFCQEILDVTRPLAGFPITTIFDASKVADDSGKFEFISDKKHLSHLYEFIDYTYVPTKDTDFVEGKTYYVDMLENDPYNGQYTYEPRYSTDNEEENGWPLMRKKWNEFYRFLTKDLSYDDKRFSRERRNSATTSIIKISDIKDANGKYFILAEPEKYFDNFLEYNKEAYQNNQEYIKAQGSYDPNKNYYVALEDDPVKVAQWKKDFENWFIKESAFYYYLFTLRYTMVDNWAKNSFWHYGKDASGKYKFEFWDYDNDTSLGIDNTGTLKMPYGVEAFDIDENGAERFRVSNSTFFVRLIKYFEKELSAFYETIQVNSSTEAFNADHFIEEFDKWQELFPEELWRWDYNRKYKRTFVGGYGANWDNAKNPLYTEAKIASDDTYLNEMMYGRKKYQRRQFERNQGFYMSSKFNDSENSGDQIQLRFGNPGEDAQVKPDYTLTLTPYLNMYLNVYNGNNRYFYQRCKAGVPYTVPFSGLTGADFIYLHGASNLQSTGDLSRTYTDQASFSAAKRLKDIILGTNLEGFKNGFLATLTIDKNNKALETLNLQNIVNESISDPKTEDLINLKYLYAQGSALKTVKFADRGLMEEAYLPSSITSIIALNLYNFHTLECESAENLTKIVVHNCPKVSATILPIVQQALNLNRARITNINWNLENEELLERLYKCKGVQEDGTTNTEHAYLSGEITITNSITRYNLNKYNELWPDLSIKLGTDAIIIEQQWIRFWNDFDTTDEEGPTLLTEFLVNRGTVLETKGLVGGVITTITYDPTVENNLSGILINIPKRANSKDGQFTYKYSGWADNFGNPLLDMEVGQVDIDFYAQFNQITRTYTINWLNGDGNVKGILENIPFGGSAKYEDAKDASNPNLKVSGLPTKANAGSKYFIFSHWDKSTGTVTPTLNEDGSDYLDIVTVNPIFNSSDATGISAKIDRENEGTLVLTPADLYAASRHSSGALMNTTIFKSAYTTKDEIQVQLGYMPTFDNVKEDIIISKDHICDGTENTFLMTNIYPFKEDIDFTLAIDFTPYYGNGSTNKYLMSAFNSEAAYGLNLVVKDTASPRLISGPVQSNTGAWIPKTNSNKVPSNVALNPLNPGLTHREICVIRKFKDENGNPQLYVYTNDRYNLTSVEKDAIAISVTKTLADTMLCFGGRSPENGKLFPNVYGKGAIHYSKIWWDDLGDAECQKICAWTYEKMNFIYNNAFNDEGLYEPRYYYESGNKTCLASFLAKDLLTEQVQFHNGQDWVNYHNSDLKTWLNTKFINAFPVEWRQVINPVQIPAVGYKAGTAVKFDDITTQANRLYVPSLIEVDTAYTNNTSYMLENTQENYSPYPQFSSNEARIRKLPIVDTAVPWVLRTPNTSRTSNRQAVTSEGLTGLNRETYLDEYGIEQSWQFYADQKYGILVGFSI